jgi:hypothetical protein
MTETNVVAVIPDALTADEQHRAKTSGFAFPKYFLPVAGAIRLVTNLLVETECAQARRPM